MATFKQNRIGQYGPKDRDLQKRMSFERLSLTAKSAYYYLYKGVKTNPSPDVTDIQDPIFLENRDREYDLEAIEVNIWYETLPVSAFDLSRIGIINPVGNTQEFRMHTLTMESDGLGRYPLAGDIIEVPFLEQDDRRAFFEVTDVDRKQEFENFIIILTTVPVEHSQETSDLHGEDGWDSNESVLEDLMDDIDQYQKDEFEETGLDDTGLDGVEQTRNTYDPRPDIAEDFLDDPNKKIF